MIDATEEVVIIGDGSRTKRSGTSRIVKCHFVIDRAYGLQLLFDLNLSERLNHIAHLNVVEVDE